ncbi:odorant receptor 22c-like isoform X2 [Athalia rosae]|uniref:odorant receptor 22c-like isoform X2 n=1 Tax=Athalia rosae TaxID=37344 RepID=UPI00203365AC|nr:odorant receptor 22c-like isoform X2 [Athalia rosae]
MERNSDIDYATSANRWALIFCGLWPDHEVKKPNRIYNLSMFALMNILNGATCVPQFVDLYFVWGDWDEMLENVMCSLCLTLMQVKVICVWRKTENLGILHEELYKDWQTQAVDDANKNNEDLLLRRSLMKSSAWMGRALCLMMTITMYATCVLFLPRPYVRSLILKLPPEERRFPYETEYLVAWVKESPYYEILYMSQIIGGVLCLTGNFATDSSIAVIMVHLCGQFKILTNDWRKFCDSATGRDDSRVNGREGNDGRANLRRELKILVERHLHLIKLAEVIEEAFNQMVLFQLVVSSTLIGIIVFHFIQSLEHADVWSFGLLVFYLISQTLFVFVYCLGGQLLINESQAVGEAIYMLEWYNLPPSIAKDLMIVMIRSKTGLTISAGKFCAMNYETFSSILKAAGTYLSVLRAMY